jgi:predicted NUDIX family NTP pyrophosphohydrolase
VPIGLLLVGPLVSQQNPDRLKPFREIDRAEWFDLEAARSKILSGKIELIDRLETEAT